MNCLMSKRRNEEESVIVLSKKKLETFYNFCVR